MLIKKNDNNSDSLWFFFKLLRRNSEKLMKNLMRSLRNYYSETDVKKFILKIYEQDFQGKCNTL